MPAVVAVALGRLEGLEVVDQHAVEQVAQLGGNAPVLAREVAYARRMFADNGWPVIDVTRRSIEETAAAIIALVNERSGLAARAID